MRERASQREKVRKRDRERKRDRKREICHSRVYIVPHSGCNEIFIAIPLYLSSSMPAVAVRRASRETMLAISENSELHKYSNTDST